MIAEKRIFCLVFFFWPAGRHVASQMNFQHCSFWCEVHLTCKEAYQQLARAWLSSSSLY